MEEQTQVSAEQVLQMQFTKVGQLLFQIEMMGKQIEALLEENKTLKEASQKDIANEDFISR
jgi:hypothetical protein